MIALLTSKAFWLFLGAGGLTVGFGLLARQIDTWIQRKQEKDEADEKLKAAEKKAQDFADTPAGDDDFHKRMHNRINNKPD